MKKLFAIWMTVAILLASGTVFAAAATTEWVTGKDTFRTIGDFEIIWDPHASEKLDLTNGSPDDWMNGGYYALIVMPENMVSWIGSKDDMPEGWLLRVQFVADKDYLYISFEAYDANPVFGTESENYTDDGDAVQMMLDLGGLITSIREDQPDDYFAIGRKKCPIYSFDAVAGGAPLSIMRQDDYNDKWLTEADGVKGSGGRTENGWFVEMALPWQLLYDDYAWKVDSGEDPRIYFGGMNNKRLEIPLTFYYLNRAKPGGDFTWAAGTSAGQADDKGDPVLTWDVGDCGINLVLPYHHDMEFTCPNMIVLQAVCGCEECGDEFESRVNESTDPPIEWWETGGVVTEPPYDVPEETMVWTNDEPVTLPPEMIETAAETLPYEYGCVTSVGMSALALIALGAALVCKKKDRPKKE